MYKKQMLSVLGLVLLLTVLWAGIRLLPGMGYGQQELLTITALPVGKADALIVEVGEQVILIDAGEKEDGEKVVRALRDRGISRIDFFLVTHFDRDHVGGAAYVMGQMEVAGVLLPDYEGDRPEYAELLACLREHPDVQRVTEPWKASVGELQVTVYPPEDPEEIRSQEGEYDNDMSLVTSIAYGNRRFLLTGDIESCMIRQMLAEDTDWKHDWIKMPHHGRYEQELSDLLGAVAPEMAVICCSEKHPAEEETLALLEEYGIPVWDTKEQAVVTVCDGDRITAEYQ